MYFKVLAALSIFLSSANGFSITGRDDWKTIRASQDVIIQQPTFASAFGPQGLFNACATDEVFKSKTPVQNCLSYAQVLKTSEAGTYKDYVCTEYEMRHVIISRTFTQNECVKHASNGECVEYDDVTSVYPTSFQLAVVDSYSQPAGDFIFSKAYRIPACE